jgi:hypothetical protein
VFPNLSSGEVRSPLLPTKLEEQKAIRKILLEAKLDLIK